MSSAQLSAVLCVLGAMVGSTACLGDVPANAAIEEIQGGSPVDVTLDSRGRVAVTARSQWARDASVRVLSAS